MSGLYADITGAGSETAAKMAAEDFGGEVLGRKIEIIAADHLNKADLSANIARDMLRQSGRRSHRRCRCFRHRARGPGDREGAQQDHHVQRPGIDPPHQRGLRSLCGALCVRHFCAGQHDGLRRRQGRPRHLVLPHRRLCIRAGPGKGHHQRGAEIRRQGAGQRQASIEHVRLLVIPVAGAKLEGKSRRACQCRRRHHQCHQAGVRIRADQGWPETVAAIGIRDRHRQRRS